MGTEGTKSFDFDNPRSLEKGLSGKELHRKLLLLTILLKNVEEILFGRIFFGSHTGQTVLNTSEFAAVYISLIYLD